MEMKGASQIPQQNGELTAKDIIITSFDVYGNYSYLVIKSPLTIDHSDLRFPTSLDASGSDAMNLAADYSAAYIILRTSKSLEGHGFAFTIGRGNDLVCTAAQNIAEKLIGKSLEELTADMGKTWRYLVSDSQLRWIGPEKESST